MWFHSRFSQKKKKTHKLFRQVFLPPLTDHHISSSEKGTNYHFWRKTKKNMQFVFLLFAFVANVSQAAQVDFNTTDNTK